jgi:hypothetical protein
MLSVKYMCVMNWLEINLLMKFALLVMQKYYQSGHSCMTEILLEYGLGFMVRNVFHFPVNTTNLLCSVGVSVMQSLFPRDVLCAPLNDSRFAIKTWASWERFHLLHNVPARGFFVKEILVLCLISERYKAPSIHRRGKKKMLVIAARRSPAQFFQLKSLLTLRRSKFV